MGRGRAELEAIVYGGSRKENSLKKLYGEKKLQEVENNAGFRLYPKSDVPSNFQNIFCHASIANESHVAYFQSQGPDKDITSNGQVFYYIHFWDPSDKERDRYWIYDGAVYCGSLKTYTAVPAPKSVAVFKGSPGAYPCNYLGQSLGSGNGQSSEKPLPPYSP